MSAMPRLWWAELLIVGLLAGIAAGVLLWLGWL
jgi:hypothetical protein